MPFINTENTFHSEIPAFQQGKMGGKLDFEFVGLDHRHVNTAC